MPAKRSIFASRRSKRKAAALTFKPLTPDLMTALGTVLRESWGTSCWCMYPRLTAARMSDPPGRGTPNERRRSAMARLGARPRAPGLLAFENEEPVGWIAIGPRAEFERVAASKATPPVDDEPVWIIPCITVRKSARGRGIALALIEAAVAFAGEHGARFVEAYPRAGNDRTGDDNVFFGTEALFRRAGFRVIRPPIPGLPKTWIPRPALRIATGRAGPPLRRQQTSGGAAGPAPA